MAFWFQVRGKKATRGPRELKIPPICHWENRTVHSSKLISRGPLPNGVALGKPRFGLPPHPGESGAQKRGVLPTKSRGGTPRGGHRQGGDWGSKKAGGVIKRLSQAGEILGPKGPGGFRKLRGARGGAQKGACARVMGREEAPQKGPRV